MDISGDAMDNAGRTDLQDIRIYRDTDNVWGRDRSPVAHEEVRYQYPGIREVPRARLYVERQ